MATVKDQVTTRRKKSVSKNDNKKKLYDYWEVLSAYDAGKKAGIKLTDKVYKKAFKDNFDKSVEACRKIYTFLKEREIECHEVLIRPEDITEFDLLFSVSRKNFNSVEFAKVYSLTANQIKNIKSKTLELSISFMPHTKDIDEERLGTEGFLTIYNGKKS